MRWDVYTRKTESHEFQIKGSQTLINLKTETFEQIRQGSLF